jgi:hypothetical protein
MARNWTTDATPEDFAGQNAVVDFPNLFPANNLRYLQAAKSNNFQKIPIF